MANDQDDFGGLREDLASFRTEAARRELLAWLGATSALALLGCASHAATSVVADAGGGGPAAGDGAANPPTCAEIPDETPGPYPGDGTNGPNVLTSSGVVRKDIRTSFGTMSGSADGVALTLVLTLVNSRPGAGCAPLPGYAVYLWHCDRDGLYSLYTRTDQNYLRGVQAAAADGTVTFTTTFPGCYPGRWPHIHVEVYPSLADAASAGRRVKTTQLALPKDACDAVYATPGYAKSATNLPMTTLATDMVFSDGSSLEVGALSGDPARGYVLHLTVGVAG